MNPRRIWADSELRALAAVPAGRTLIAAAASLLLFTLVGLAVLWPGEVGPGGPSQALGGHSTGAKVVRADTVRCPGPGAQRCRVVRIEVDGRRSPLTLGPVAVTPELEAGDKIRVTRAAPEGRPLPEGVEPWQFQSIDRRGSLLWLVIALAVATVAVIRWRGVLALLGVALSLLLVTQFIVPAILDGGSALLVALVGSLAVMFVTLVLTNGIGAQTLAAALGIGSTLLLTALLGLLATDVAALDGRSGELSQVLAQQGSGLSLEGVVLAGMVIGALGVLTDTAVTQASAVMALRRTDPSLSVRALYRRAFTIGRDHLSATIHTLVLAYVGAALPLLLVLRSSGVSATDGLNLQEVAEPIAATLIGCLGLVAAIPLMTGLAAALVAHVPAVALRDGHGHHHH